ncbi:unnamed protein product [Vitrella brassicaformis CCMP3155]|uniref:Uncharacterized protein n=1 Tax=Vitrella brassicaformis (strain CCMP3155) TaxID=1169540 RepID=A0A0G4H749_VITBC|nr:unnamed protein product [Vitrella brassicaformis CCMP3155]|eukprot:CEM39680.1 unnamed protein product [Vitrella brassicaformis CCMP3155]
MTAADTARQLAELSFLLKALPARYLSVAELHARAEYVDAVDKCGQLERAKEAARKDVEDMKKACAEAEERIASIRRETRQVYVHSSQLTCDLHKTQQEQHEYEATWQSLQKRLAAAQQEHDVMLRHDHKTAKMTNENKSEAETHSRPPTMRTNERRNNYKKQRRSFYDVPQVINRPTDDGHAVRQAKGVDRVW